MELLSNTEAKGSLRPWAKNRCDEYSNLTVRSLTKEQRANTCGYWYLVESEYRAHTAFANRDHLIRWLEERGLSMDGDLPMSGTYGMVSVTGSYRATMHMSYDKFYSLDGIQIRSLSNGDYTLGIIDKDEDGISNVHTLNPNMRDRMVFDYAASRALVG